MSEVNPKTILVIDDEYAIVDILSQTISSLNHNTCKAYDSDTAIAILKKREIDLVMLDVFIPGINGIDLIAKIHEMSPILPVILMTGQADINLTLEAIKKGAYDFLIKPFNNLQIQYAIKRGLEYCQLKKTERDYQRNLEETVKAKTQELIRVNAKTETISKEIVSRMIGMAEFRDTDTGSHIHRIGLYSEAIANHLKMPPEFINNISMAAPFHDIGKVGIPDKILLKEGPLTQEEYDVMKGHTVLGKRFLEGSNHPVLKMGEVIAATHHECWDGNGYPLKLKESEIPIEGRIVLLADIYDALRSKRPYKNPLNHQEVIKIILEGDGRTKKSHFDPEVLSCFEKVHPEFEKIFNDHN